MYLSHDGVRVLRICLDAGHDSCASTRAVLFRKATRLRPPRNRYGFSVVTPPTKTSEKTAKSRRYSRRSADLGNMMS